MKKVIDFKMTLDKKKVKKYKAKRKKSKNKYSTKTDQELMFGY